MSSKINIGNIIGGYLNTFRAYGSGKISWGDVSVFILIPSVIAVISFMLDVTLADSMFTNILTAASIFAGLLFNLLLLIFDLMSKQEDSCVPEKSMDPEKKQKLLASNKLLQEFYSIISFLILSSVAIVFLSVSGVFLAASNQGSRLPEQVSDLLANSVSAALLFLGVNFLLSLLMALKRTHVLLTKVHIN